MLANGNDHSWNFIVSHLSVAMLEQLSFVIPVLFCFVHAQPAQKLSGDTLLKNLHPDLRLYIIKEFSISRPAGFCLSFVYLLRATARSAKRVLAIVEASVRLSVTLQYCV